MDKSTDKNEKGHTEGTVTPKLVFSDDALVVDYLNALLTSSPAITLDSGEIHFVHMAIGNGWKPAGAATEVIAPPLFHENEQSTMEADTLRNENENLRFKSELSKIDVQVLRSENNNLKAEVAGLKTRLHKMEHSFETVVTENSDLRLRIDAAQSELDSLTAKPTNDMQQEQAASARSESFDAVEGAVGQEEEQAANATIPHDISAEEVIPGIPATPVIIEQKDHTGDKIHFGNDQNTSIISPVSVTDDRAKQKLARDVVFSPRKNIVVNDLTERIRPVSKIIKQQQHNTDQRHQEADQAYKAAPQKPLQRESTPLPAEKRTDLVQQHQGAESELKPEDVTVSNREILHLDDTDKIQMEPAPAPKVIVRRNVKNYEDLQKETDSAHTTLEGHTVIL